MPDNKWDKYAEPEVAEKSKWDKYVSEEPIKKKTQKLFGSQSPSDTQQLASEIPPEGLGAPLRQPSAGAPESVLGSISPTEPYKYSFDEIKPAEATTTYVKPAIISPKGQAEKGVSGKHLNLGQEPVISPTERVSTSIGEEQRRIPLEITQTPIAELRKEGVAQTPSEKKRAQELIPQTEEDYVVAHAKGIYSGLRSAATAIEDLVGINPNKSIFPDQSKGVLTENPEYKSFAEKKAGNSLDIVKGIAHTIFEGMAFTPAGVVVIKGAEQLPDKVNEYLFAPISAISSDFFGYVPKEGTLQEKFITTGDIFGSIATMHGAGKLGSKIFKKKALTPEELPQIKEVIDKATPEDFAKAMEENGYVPIENKVVDIIEKKNKDVPTEKDIASISIDKENFDNVLDVAKQSGQLNEIKANELKQEFDNIDKAKEKTPDEHKGNPEIVSLISEKSKLESKKEKADKVFHPELDKKIKEIDTKIGEQITKPTEVVSKAEVKGAIPFTDLVDIAKKEGEGVELSPEEVKLKESYPDEFKAEMEKLKSPMKTSGVPEDKNYEIAQEVNKNIANKHPNTSVLILPKGDDLSLTSIFVKKGEREQGIGTSVLETVKSEADRTGKKIVLDATTELDAETDIARLNEFYERNGFTKIGENKFEYNPKPSVAIGEPSGKPKTTDETVTPSVVASEPKVEGELPSGKVEAKEFKGKEISIVHNPEKAPDMGERFNQHLEPKGKYVVESETPPKGWEQSKVKFDNPLIIETDGSPKWKKDLSDKYGLKGKELSDKLLSEGYDGIITVEKNDTGEIVILDKSKGAQIGQKPSKEPIEQPKLRQEKGFTEPNFPRTNENYTENEAFKEVKNKYESAPKETGRITTEPIASGDLVKGKYILIDADNVTSTHNEKTFAKSKGVPVNERGETINDRNYEADKSAQASVIRHSGRFDRRAVKDAPMITKEGIVFSGNDRTMARKLSAEKGTDVDYMEGLREKAEMYGIDPAKIDNFKKPMLVFELETTPEYSTREFRKYNVEEKKAKSTLEEAVEISKSISQEAKDKVSNFLSRVSGVTELQASKVLPQLRDVLLEEKIITHEAIPKYFSAEGKLTETGKDLLENIVLGSIFKEAELRTLNEAGMKSLRNKLSTAGFELSENSRYAEFNVLEHLKQAI